MFFFVFKLRIAVYLSIRASLMRVLVTFACAIVYLYLSLGWGGVVCRICRSYLILFDGEVNIFPVSDRYRFDKGYKYMGILNDPIKCVFGCFFLSLLIDYGLYFINQFSTMLPDMNNYFLHHTLLSHSYRIRICTDILNQKHPSKNLHLDCEQVDFNLP